jgi:hypothetical protein
MSEEERANFRQYMAGNRRNTNTDGTNWTNFATGRANRQGANAPSAARMMIARTSGEIIDIADGIITIKLEEGGSKLVFYSDQTTVNIISN